MIYFNKYEFHTFIESFTSNYQNNKRLLWLNSDGIKNLLAMNTMEELM